MHRFVLSLVPIFLLLGGMAAQEARKPAGAVVTAAPPELVVLTKGKPARVQLLFRVAPGYHINSSKPSNELLIPTVLKMDPPTDILVGKIAYPAGSDISLPLLQGEKLNVYSGDFAITGMVSASQSIPVGTYKVRGQLKYQACNDRQCFPPRQLPLDFNVKVRKASSGGSRPRRSPGQSPHVHR
jgi:hypothetical protein